MEANKVILNGTTLIDLTSDTVTAADVASGKTFHTADGVKRTGALVPATNKLNQLFTGTLTEITLEDIANATEIIPRQFDSQLQLRSVALPDTLVTIGREAFYGCKNLEKVASSVANTLKLPQSIQSLGEGAFYNCYKLATIDLQNAQITQIPNSCFANVTDNSSYLFKLQLGLVTTIGQSAFSSNVKSSVIMQVIDMTAIQTINQYAFRNQGVNNIKLGTVLSSIDRTAFMGCPLENIAGANNQINVPLITNGNKIICYNTVCANGGTVEVVSSNSDLQQIADFLQMKEVVYRILRIM